MKTSIEVSSSFSAAHWHDRTLNEAAHKHNFKYAAVLTAPLNTEGYIADFRAVEAAMAALNATLEGKVLNDILPAPTTENLAAYIFNALAKNYPQLTKVIVYEQENYAAVVEK